MKSSIERVENDGLFKRGTLLEFVGLGHSFVVFVTDCVSESHVAGFVVWSENKQRNIGYYSSTWITSEFKEFSGKITLEQ
jgi:hypothetical protein